MFSRVVAFLPGYATSKTHQFDIDTIPGARMTDLIYCFAGFTQQGNAWVVGYPEPDDSSPHGKSNLAKLIALKKKWPALNVCVSIGGWNHSHQGDPNFKTTPVFSAIAATPQARQTFVSSCIDLFIKPAYPRLGPLFGGIDIDWEFPAPADRHNLTLLFQEFRKQLDAEGRAGGRQLTLSASTGVDSQELELGLLGSTLDWVNVMAYIAHEPNTSSQQNQFTDFNSPIYGSPAEPASNVTWNIDTVANAFLATGFPAAKLVLGVSAYARTYGGVSNANHGVYQPYAGPGPGSLGKQGVLEYKDLMVNYLPGYESHWDDATRSAYLYNPADQAWISYDSVESLAAKAAYVNQRQLGGLMLWELSADAPSSDGLLVPQNVPALIDAIPFGIRSLANKSVLKATSPSSPGLSFLEDKIFLACRRSEADALEIMFSTDNGGKFGGTYRSAESSAAGPALAAHNDRLMIAWKGSGNDNLNVAEVGFFADSQGKFGIEGLANKIVLGDTADGSPALASHDGRLFLAWKGSGNDNLNVMFSSDGGATFSGKYVSPETSDAAPALASHNGRLMIAWKGSGNDNLNVAEVGFFADSQGGFGIEGFTSKVVLGDTADGSPALASNDGRLFLAWKGSGNDNLNVMFSPDGGATFSGKYVSPETSDVAPALAANGTQMVLGWKGSGNDNLNVAQVALF
ncbi:MAG TPA: glycoside hydrolase family 18 protein [Candidatus Acidoferrales bacterium]|nr:glycoside hydrolase family 18 protein [Candidatus Acidoferrales bacterium]